ncbi:MAG TPA: hypothetical protein VLI06_06790 [Solimonas sp.]|nr:hypothetical protein [Solimonas sp.]
MINHLPRHVAFPRANDIEPSPVIAVADVTVVATLARRRLQGLLLSLLIGMIVVQPANSGVAVPTSGTVLQFEAMFPLDVVTPIDRARRNHPNTLRPCPCLAGPRAS